VPFGRLGQSQYGVIGSWSRPRSKVRLEGETPKRHRPAEGLVTRTQTATIDSAGRSLRYNRPAVGDVRIKGWAGILRAVRSAVLAAGIFTAAPGVGPGRRRRPRFFSDRGIPAIFAAATFRAGRPSISQPNNRYPTAISPPYLPGPTRLRDGQSHRAADRRLDDRTVSYGGNNKRLIMV